MIKGLYRLKKVHLLLKNVGKKTYLNTSMSLKTSFLLGGLGAGHISADMDLCV